MHDVLVMYGHPEDPEGFDQHYRDVHVPLVRALPRLHDFTWSHVLDEESEFFVIARLSFADADAAADALASPAGERATQDVATFATGGATLLHLAIVDE
jgi:uncharacterized protein (TIGR02118 family)